MRGHLLVDGHGHQESYCTCIQENLRHSHFNCAYALLEGKNQLGLTDINGKPIVRGLLEAATATSDKGEGWYHYQWPVPGGLLPRWKSSYVRRVKAPSGKHYVVGCGSYNDRMERIFVVDIVKNAIGKIEKEGMGAFAAFHDTAGPFFAKDAYIFVIDQK